MGILLRSVPYYRRDVTNARRCHTVRLVNRSCSSPAGLWSIINKSSGLVASPTFSGVILSLLPVGSHVWTVLEGSTVGAHTSAACPTVDPSHPLHSASRGESRFLRDASSYKSMNSLPPRISTPLTSMVFDPVCRRIPLFLTS